MGKEIRKTTFAWASIAGADAEPVELMEVDGRKGLYTLGCADAFWLDDASIGIVVFGGTPLNRPDHPETQEQRDERESTYKAKAAVKKAAYEWHRDNAKHGPHCIEAECETPWRHGWRGPR